jgi:tRNA (guanine-N7-)-methyltransferase
MNTITKKIFQQIIKTNNNNRKYCFSIYSNQLRTVIDCIGFIYNQKTNIHTIFPKEHNIDDINVEILKDSSRRQINDVNSHLKLNTRQHVNPLSGKYQVKLELEKDWLKTSFQDIYKSYIIDIGCAKGSWALQYAKENPNINILGLEIRIPVVHYALARKIKRNLKNAHFVSCNVNIDLFNIIASIKDAVSTFNSNQDIIDNNSNNINLNGFLPINSNNININNNINNIPIKLITIQFPDPHFKTKQKKRRIVNDDLVNSITSIIDNGTHIFLQSDVLEVEIDMIETFLRNSSYYIENGYCLENLESNINPFNIKTEREIATEAKNLPIYRMLLVKSS